MTSTEVNNIKKRIYNTLSGNRIHTVIPIVTTLVNDTTAWQLHDELNQLKTEHNYLLNYFIKGIKDPEREKIYSNFIKRLYSITDRAVCEILTREDYGLYYSTKRVYKKTQKNLEALLESYRDILSHYSLHKELPEDKQDINTTKELLSNKENLESDIFKYLWTSFPLSGTETESFNSIFECDNYPIYFKSHIISAILLSLLQYYNEPLLINLLEQYNNPNGELSAKSLCAAIIVMYNHNDRIDYSGRIKNILDSYADSPQFVNDVKNILFTLVKSRNTEKITKKVNDELIPKLIKLYPKVFKKIKGDKNSIDISDLEENPEWKGLIENENITKKIEELNKLQMDGGDVFIGTFSHLKSFSFFNEISNWFIPFHNEHSILLNSLTPNESKQLAIIFDSKFFCDSDKYSFVASLASVPQSQRNLMFSQLDEQNNAIKELKISELPATATIQRENIINNFIQNIYRFFNFYNRKNDFINPLNNCFNILKIKEYFKTIDFKDILTIIAEFYLKNEYYSDAISYFLELGNNQSDFKPIILQKIGFCYQNMENYEKAIEYYNKYELYSENDLWNLRHIAACYRAVKQPETALKYYLEAIQFSPENIPLNLNIGHCYLELDNYSEALKYYFKINYLEPYGLRSLRPIAWCLFVQKNFEQARNYYEKILQEKPSSTDFLNVGHLEFACDNISKAISYYKESISKGNYSIQQFIEIFHSDENTLQNVGVKQSDISILLDAISQEFENR